MVWNGDTAYIVLVPSTSAIKVLGDTVLIVDIPLIDTDILIPSDSQMEMWKSVKTGAIEGPWSPQFDMPGWRIYRNQGPQSSWYWTYRTTVRIRVDTGPVDGGVAARILTRWPLEIPPGDSIALHYASMEGANLRIHVR